MFIIYNIYRNVLIANNEVTRSSGGGMHIISEPHAKVENTGTELVLCSAPSVPQPVFTIREKAPTRAFSWLKAPTSAFT